METFYAPIPTVNISAIVVSYNGAPFIAACLESLQQSNLKLNVIVVDNASTDETQTVVRRFKDVDLIEGQENIGFGRGCNIGISHAMREGADYFLILNQDAKIEPDTVDILIQSMKSNPKIGIACPLQFDANGEAIDNIFLRFYLSPYATSLISDAIRGKMQPIYAVEQAPAAAWLISATCLMEVGGFDPLFFMYGEDDDMCRRCIFHGYEIVIVAEARFSHLRAFYASANSEWIVRKLKRRSSRMRSTLVANAKKLRGNPLKNFYHAAVDQLCTALAGLLGHLDWIPVVASLAAICGGIVDLPRIIHHRKISIGKGAHWLSSLEEAEELF